MLKQTNKPTAAAGVAQPADRGPVTAGVTTSVLLVGKTNVHLHRGGAGGGFLQTERLLFQTGLQYMSMIHRSFIKEPIKKHTPISGFSNLEKKKKI